MNDNPSFIPPEEKAKLLKRIKELEDLGNLQKQAEKVVSIATGGEKIKPGSDMAALLKVVTGMAKKKP